MLCKEKIRGKSQELCSNPHCATWLTTTRLWSWPNPAGTEKEVQKCSLWTRPAGETSAPDQLPKQASAAKQKGTKASSTCGVYKWSSIHNNLHYYRTYNPDQKRPQRLTSEAFFFISVTQFEKEKYKLSGIIRPKIRACLLDLRKLHSWSLQQLL